MSQIQSPHNPRLKAVRHLHTKRGRARSATFLAEGEDLIAAAQHAGRAPLEGYRLAGSGLGDDDFHEVERAALASASALGSGTRVMAVYQQRWGTPHGPLCVYLHRVGDPGNVGTVLRSAQAFGASCVALGPGCADPHGGKAVRASMGAIFTVELARVGDVAELPGERIALVADGGEILRGPLDGDGNSDGDGELAAGAAAGLGTAARPGARAVTLLVGAERDGLPDELVAACDRSARIPIASDSLNAAMAATVALYEMTRQSYRCPARPNDTVPAS